MNKIMSIFNVIQILRKCLPPVSNTCPPLSFAILSIIGNLLGILLLLFSNVNLRSCLLFFLMEQSNLCYLMFDLLFRRTNYNIPSSRTLISIWVSVVALRCRLLCRPLCCVVSSIMLCSVIHYAV